MVKKEKSISQQIEELGCQIVAEIDHGECFYDKDMLKDFIKTLDTLKIMSKKYYEKNKAEMEEQE